MSKRNNRGTARIDDAAQRPLHGAFPIPDPRFTVPGFQP